MCDLLEVAIGIEPMNKGFAVLNSQFLCVLLNMSKRVSVAFLVLEPPSEYV